MPASALALCQVTTKATGSALNAQQTHFALTRIRLFHALRYQRQARNHMPTIIAFVQQSTIILQISVTNPECHALTAW
jgi:hypothetical protein